MAKSNPVNIRLENEVLNEIKKLAKTLRLSLSAVLNRLIIESVRMYQFPGIIFVTSPSGRRAAVSGTGLDVWELVLIYQRYKKNEKKLLHDYPLTQMQLYAALNYYAKYKKEIDDEIKENNRIEDLLIHTKEFPEVISLNLE